MRAICTQENLTRALELVSGIAGKHVNLPILNNVLIQADKEGITLTTTNLEIGIKTLLRGKVEEVGAYTVQAKLLGDFVRSLPRENITLSQKDSTLILEGENHQTKMKGEPAVDFPLIPDITPELSVSLSADDLRTGLTQVLFAASTDESRPELNGVYIHLEDTTMTLVATDSYRLAEKKLTLKEPLAQPHSLIVPARTFGQVIKMLTTEDTSGPVTLAVNDNQIKCSLGSTEIVSRIVVGQYPDYNQIIPTEFASTVTVKVSDIMQTIRTTALFCQPGINDVKISYVPDTGELQLRAQNSTSGDNMSRLKATITGQAGDLVFNHRYVTEGLNVLGGEVVEMKLNSNNVPAVLNAQSDTSYRYLIMPIKQ
jgi:DNA polymerase-3 subunit beta